MTTKELVKLVEFETGVSLRDNSRKTDHVMARAIYYKLGYELLNIGTYNTVGSELGKDHSTVLYSIKNHWFGMRRDFPNLHKAYLRCVDIIEEGVLSSYDYEKKIDHLKTKLGKVKYTNTKLKEQVKMLEDSFSKVVESKGHPVQDEVIGMIMKVNHKNLALFKFRLTGILGGL